MRARTPFSRSARGPRLLRVRNETSWPHADFVDWLDGMMRKRDIPNDATLARQAGIDASLISNWRSGKQQPSTKSLDKVCVPLRVKPVAAYIHAGLLNPDDLGIESEDREPVPAIVLDLAEVYERLREAGREDIAVSHISTLVKLLKVELSDIEAAQGTDRPSGRGAGRLTAR